MKHKVKLLGVHDGIIKMRVDGELCAYLIQRPQPLDLTDAKTLQNVMDTSIMGALFRASGLVNPQETLYQKFCRFVGSWGRRERVPVLHLSCDIADFIERVGVEVNIDKKTKGFVILKSDVDKIRAGGRNESLG